MPILTEDGICFFKDGLGYDKSGSSRKEEVEEERCIKYCRINKMDLILPNLHLLKAKTLPSRSDRLGKMAREQVDVTRSSLSME